VLESGELLGEPLPTRDNRQAILFYEASEGGAGVLKRLMEGPERWQRLAEVALELMHYRRRGDELEQTEDACVAGCYRCLLSYYNQPEHEIIDRRDPAVLNVLLQLAACSIDRPVASGTGQAGEIAAWLDAFEHWGVPKPSPEDISGESYPLCWPSHMVMAVLEPPSDALQQRCKEMGRFIVELPRQPGTAIPSELAAMLGVLQ
jgi:hypothetical protein